MLGVFVHLWYVNLYSYRAGGEDDFEKFLEGVKARSLRNTAHLRKSKNDLCFNLRSAVACVVEC